MDSLDKKIIRSQTEGRLAEFVSQEFLNRHADSDEFLRKLARLSNEGHIDLLGAFAKIENSIAFPNFFPAKILVEKVLPLLNSPIVAILRCLQRLRREAGQDLSASSVFPAFEEYCLKDPQRPSQAFDTIIASPADLSLFLQSTLRCGSRFAFEVFYKRAVGLCQDENIELRSQALSALGHLEYPEDPSILGATMDVLEEALLREPGEQELACIIDSIFHICRHENSLTARAETALEDSIRRDVDVSVHIFSRLFARYADEFSTQQIQFFLHHLRQVRPQSLVTLQQVDIGLGKLLRRGKLIPVITFLESVTNLTDGAISLNVFKMCTTSILDERLGVLNRVTTRWLTPGNYHLAKSLSEALLSSKTQELELTVVIEEVPKLDANSRIRLAESAVGFLFLSPVLAASFVLSLAKRTRSKQIQSQLASLLFDPLMISFPGSVAKFLKSRLKGSSASESLVAKDALCQQSDYESSLRSIGNLPEMHPNQLQIEIANRHFNTALSAAYEEAESRSPLLSAIKKSVILHGAHTVFQITDHEGNRHRSVTPLHLHSTEMEFPRYQFIDPVGIDHMLRRYRQNLVVT